jgi:hypothetical protein
VLLLGTGVAIRYFSRALPTPEAPPSAESSTPAPGRTASSLEDLPPLEETAPPAGLPIVPWGKRDHFPVIRNPRYVNAREGDRLLAVDEPILGLVQGGEARAYSTNQLNEHEMVLDTVAGVPLLITY